MNISYILRLFSSATRMNTSISKQVINKDWRLGSVLSNEGKFTMPWLMPVKKSLSIIPPVIKWLWNRKSPSPPPTGTFPVIKPDFTAQQHGFAKITWIGHATCLLQIDGITILTDAVFSNRASPVQWAGPKRFVQPACKISELPKVDLLLTSHNHYDHLDYQSVKQLEALHKPIFVCGLNLGRWFTDNFNVGNERIAELDWWQTKSFLNNRVQVHFVPTQHWSKRNFSGDDRKTLWGGFMVELDGFKFFFNGDTGYSSELYEEIGKRFGLIDAAAIPIGVYEPRYIMKQQHIDPDEAILIHKQLRSRCSFGIHHSTFMLTDEPLSGPAERIQKISVSNPQSPPFFAIKHGAHIQYNLEGRSCQVIE